MNILLTKAGLIAAGDIAGLTLILRDELIRGIDNIPSELRILECWVVYKVFNINPVTGKFSKVPYYPCSRQPRSGPQNSPEDLRKLGRFEDAMAAFYADPTVAGIGIAMRAELGIVALDFDACVVEGRIHPQVEALICGTYSEISPSGRGVRAFMRGTLPSRKSPAQGHPFGFEIFCDTGFVTITGNLTDICEMIGNENVIEDVTPEIKMLYEQRFGLGSERDPSASRSGNPLLTYKPKMGLSLSQLRGYVFQLGPNCSYNGDGHKDFGWLRTGMCIHHETDGSQEGLELFDEWSKGSKTKYAGRRDIESKWRSFDISPEFGTVTARSLVHHVNQKNARDQNAPILDPKDPMGCANMFLKDRFQTEHGVTLLHYKGLWYTYKEGNYEETSDITIRGMIWDYLAGAFKHYKDTVIPFKPLKTQIDGTMDALRPQVDVGKAQPPVWLDGYGGPAPKDLVSLKNGLLHIPSRQLIDHTPGFFTLNTLPYAWDERAECPLWMEFLEQLWPGDSESQETLQEIFGYLLTPDTSQHKIFLIVGPRRSGKGTMGRVAGELLGGDNVVSPQLSSLLTQFGMEPLIGKLLALLSDARIGGQTNVQALVERLLMISGEDSITIDRKFRQAWSGTLGARFLFMSNEVPQLGDASNALSGRFIILSLRESFYGREDPSLTQRLLLELPGIFKWALDGKERLAKRGHFLQPAGGLDDVEELVAMGSPISVFLMDCCELDASYHVPIQKLYSEWLKWNYTHGRANPGTAQTFGKLLRAAQPRIRRSYPMLQGERERYYEGIRLKVEPGNEFL